MFDIYKYESIDWDDEDDPDGNLVHCLRWGVDERVVGEVLAGQPAEINKRLETAEFAVAGPDEHGQCWTILFDTSWKRGDWLRPITGWKSKPAEENAWRKAMGR